MMSKYCFLNKIEFHNPIFAIDLSTKKFYITWGCHAVWHEIRSNSNVSVEPYYRVEKNNTSDRYPINKNLIILDEYKFAKAICKYNKNLAENIILARKL